MITAEQLSRIEILARQIKEMAKKRTYDGQLDDIREASKLLHRRIKNLQQSPLERDERNFRRIIK